MDPGHTSNPGDPTPQNRSSAEVRWDQVQSSDEDSLRHLFRELCNRGRWGDDDQLGTLNYISAAKVAAAATLATNGRVVSIAHDIDTTPSKKNRRPAVFRMLDMGAQAMSSADEVTIAPHSITVTHVDALSHCFFRKQVYNGRAVADVITSDGALFGSVYAQRNGIVTRGVLLDVAASRSVDYLKPADTVTPQDLDVAERYSGCVVEPGDAVFVRVGLGAREAVEGLEDGSERAGLDLDCLRWLHSKQVSVYGGDCFDKIPSSYAGISHPFHAMALVAMGLIMIDNVATEPLADACREFARSAFMLVVAPLRIRNGTGSAVNPLCIF